MHWKVCIKWLAVSWQGVVWAEGQRWTSSCAMLDACLMAGRCYSIVSNLKLTERKAENVSRIV